MKRGIKLRGITGPIKGKQWSSESLLRAGRLSTLEILLDDNSVSRKHAEIRLNAEGIWVVFDQESTNGTYINGNRLAPNVEQQLKPRDIVQFGKIALMVEMTDVTSDGPPSNQLVLAARIGASDSVPMTSDRASPSPNRPLFDREKMPRVGEQLIALLRAGRHLSDLQSEDQLLDSILHDAVSVLDAQRGAIVLAESSGNSPEPKLKLRSLAVGPREPGNRFPFSKRLVQKAFQAGESMLFTNLSEDEEFKMHQSIQDGAMASVLCVLLRTPRRRLGVLHLDRGFFQAPFTEGDLHLADALAAHVSSGIECATLLRKQREFFIKTVMAIAQAVELRDSYTYGHTQRVTEYSVALGKKLELPADQIALLEFGTPLHDIGKLAIPDSILQKPGRLTAHEFAIMQTHTTRGAEYLSAQEIPELNPVIPIVRSHHERWDGTGYPDRIAREEIPLIARIVAVCDAFDAMTSDRPYHEGKRGRPAEQGFLEIERQAGRQFDPNCAQAFLAIKDEILRIMPGGSDRISETGPPTLSGSQPEVAVIGDSLAEFQTYG